MQIGERNSYDETEKKTGEKDKKKTEEYTTNKWETTEER